MLTERQRQILDFLTKYVDAHGYPPTVREIGEAVGLASPSTVHAHLANLERAGLLKRDPTKPRAIELRPRAEGRAGRPTCTGSRSSARSPRVGRCSPRTTSRSTSPCPSRSRAAARSSSCASRATRWSTPGILDGDIVVVAAGSRTRGTATSSSRSPATTRRPTRRRVKRFFREDGRVRLQPENDALEPIYARARPDPRQGDRSLPAADERGVPNRTLEQELFALLRGASLECLVCGEFVLHARRRDLVPRVRHARVQEQPESAATIELAGRVTASRSRLEESPDTEGQDAGETPGGESRRKVAQKGDRQRRQDSPETPKVRVKRWGKSPPALW